MTSTCAVEANFSSLTLDTEATLRNVCRVLCNKADLPAHLPVSIEGSALSCLQSAIPADVGAGVQQSIYGGASLTLRFAAAANILEWVDAMQEAGYACNWGPPSVFRLYWTMRRSGIELCTDTEALTLELGGLLMAF
jgi:hypothetical protein